MDDIKQIATMGWRTNVGEKLWRRVDPAKAGADELAFTNRKVEEEIRTEIERDAAMLKAFAKLEQRKPAPEDH